MRKRVDRCSRELLPKWQDRLADTPTYLVDDCWAMMESIIMTSRRTEGKPVRKGRLML